MALKQKTAMAFFLLAAFLFLSSNAFAETRWKVTKFTASTGTPDAPLYFPASASIAFSSIVIKVKNLSDGPERASVTLDVLHPATNEVIVGASGQITQTVLCSLVAVGNECELDQTDFVALNGAISSLEPGAYKLRASAFDTAAPPTRYDYKALYFTVGNPVPVPELDFILLPAIAFSIVAIAFFSGKCKH